MNKTQNIFKTGRALAIAALAATTFAACEDEPDKYEVAGGSPELIYVTTTTRPDSIMTAASMGARVVLVGNNLRSIVKLYFNDREAVLNSSLITDHTLVCSVPNSLPETPTDSIYMENSAGQRKAFPFSVVIPAPTLLSMDCEMVKPGSVATINGDYLLDYEDFPMVVTMPDGTEITDFEECEKTSVSFIVPEGCTTPGPITVTSKYGTTTSTRFNFNDNRGLITDFDGTTDVVPQGWNISREYKTEGGISGQYAELKGDMTEGGDWNEAFKLPFWCGNWNGDPMGITSGPGVPICNIIDFSDWQNMAIKFELCIPSSNPWSAGAMQVVFTDAETCANDAWQNNTYIQPDQGLCRGLYRPWESTGSFDTGDQWITVTIPFSQFTYNADGTPGTVPLASADDFASLIIWPWSGGVTGTACSPVFRYDNIRAVPYK